MNYIYLIQGEAKRIGNYFHLSDRPNCQAFYLTYDKEVEGCLFYPNSTWAEGRNRLLEQIGADSYDYLIMVDDDIEFIKGDWNEFELTLEKYQPAVAVPLVTKVKRSPITEEGRKWEVQNFMINDEQFIAIHSSVVKDKILLPYITKFDETSWWAACEIQQILIQTIYSPHILQFNNLSVENLIHGRHDASDKSYKKAIRTWLSTQLKVSMSDIWHYWEDWPGIHIGFDLDKFSTGNYSEKLIYEKNFRRLISRTESFMNRLGKIKSPDYTRCYTLSLHIKKQLFNPKSRYL